MKTVHVLPCGLVLLTSPSRLACPSSNLLISLHSWSIFQFSCKRCFPIPRPWSLLPHWAIFPSKRCLQSSTQRKSLRLSISQHQWRANHCMYWEWPVLLLGALSIRKSKIRLSWWINTKMLFISERFFWAWEKSKPKTLKRCCSASRILDLNSL